MLDVIIIGAGVIGGAIARYLSKYDVKALVIEKECDVACGTSKANSGISHAGFDAKVGSLKAKYNVLGNKMMEPLSKELDFPYIKNGAFVLGFSENSKAKLEELYQNGIANGVTDLEIITGDKAREIEPKLSSEVKWALYAKTSGIVSPYELTIALCENAYVNKVDFIFDSEVTNLHHIADHFEVEVNGSSKYRSQVVINASGMHCDEISKMVGINNFEIISRKGEYLLLDKNEMYTKTTLFQTPTKMGKGILVAPTTHGNTLVGPTACDIESKTDTSTTSSGLDEAWSKALLSIPTLNKRQVITQFSGLRSHSTTNDFIVGWTNVEGFYNVSGIESPGLTASIAIGEHVSLDVSKYLGLKLKEDFIPTRVGIRHIVKLDKSEQMKLIKENPQYAHIICRCEEVTEAEIVDSINRPLGAKTLDGVKRRTRCGMGRCQMGFCTPKIMEILARELKCDITEITKNGKESKIVIGKVE